MPIRLRDVLKKINVEPGNTKYKTTPDKRCLLDSDDKLTEILGELLSSPEACSALGDRARNAMAAHGGDNNFGSDEKTLAKSACML